MYLMQEHVFFHVLAQIQMPVVSLVFPLCTKVMFVEVFKDCPLEYKITQNLSSRKPMDPSLCTLQRAKDCVRSDILPNQSFWDFVKAQASPLAWFLNPHWLY